MPINWTIPEWTGVDANADDHTNAFQLQPGSARIIPTIANNDMLRDRLKEVYKNYGLSIELAKNESFLTTANIQGPADPTGEAILFLAVTEVLKQDGGGARARKEGVDYRGVEIETLQKCLEEYGDIKGKKSSEALVTDTNARKYHVAMACYHPRKIASASIFKDKDKDGAEAQDLLDIPWDKIFNNTVANGQAIFAKTLSPRQGITLLFIRWSDTVLLVTLHDFFSKNTLYGTDLAPIQVPDHIMEIVKAWHQRIKEDRTLKDQSKLLDTLFNPKATVSEWQSLAHDLDYPLKLMVLAIYRRFQEMVQHHAKDINNQTRRWWADVIRQIDTVWTEFYEARNKLESLAEGEDAADYARSYTFLYNLTITDEAAKNIVELATRPEAQTKQLAAFVADVKSQSSPVTVDVQPPSGPKICRKCHRPGHIAKNCPTKKGKKAQAPGAGKKEAKETSGRQTKGN